MRPAVFLLLAALWLRAGACAAAPPTEARVAVPLAGVYRSPSTTSERVTEVFLWDRLLIQEFRGGWVRILVADQYRTPRGYPGWIRRDALAPGTPEELDQTVVVSVPRAPLRAAPGGKEVLQVYLGTRLVVSARSDGGWTATRLPGKRQLLWVDSSSIHAEEVPPTADGQALVETASRFQGTDYLWGGLSTRGIDCSGLVYSVYRSHGWLLPRDADQQFQVGEPVERSALKPGDLVFFGDAPGHVSHVGIYAGQDRFIHAAGKGVAVNSLDEPDHGGRYQGGRRIVAGSPSRPQRKVPRD